MGYKKWQYLQTVQPVVLGLLFLVLQANWTEVSAQSEQFQAIFRPESAGNLPPLDSVAEGYVALFDGHSLFGWRQPNGSRWKVEDGAFVADGRQAGLLRTASQFDCFVLELKFNCDADATAEVLLRTSPEPDESDAIRILLAGKNAETANGTIPGKENTRKGEAIASMLDDQDFQSLRVEATPQGVIVRVNGIQVSNVLAEQFDVKRGYLGLRCSKGNVRFKDVFLRPLMNLDNWTTQDSSDSKRVESRMKYQPTMTSPLVWSASRENDFQYSMDRKEITLSGGPGFVESDLRFGNFVWQSKCRISPGGNSGVFFRCVPGQNTNGYESQIDNSRIDGDWNQPANCGTGGIFRRKDARRIVAVDDQWFAKTIIVEGPHVAIWVNGYQVIDWTDKRAANENPRRGLRTDAGTLMLQGHDQETTTRFREINVREIWGRR